MVSIARVNIWNAFVGAVAWDDSRGYAAIEKIISKVMNWSKYADRAKISAKQVKAIEKTFLLPHLPPARLSYRPKRPNII